MKHFESSDKTDSEFSGLRKHGKCDGNVIGALRSEFTSGRRSGRTAMIRSAAKSFAFSSGALNFVHHVRNSDTLTVVMFHRVLPAMAAERANADAVWTVTPEFLADCVGFFRQNYSIVGLEDVLRARAQEKTLPPRSLLITFDDGWRDNLDWAMPILQGIPWVLFVATDAADEPALWWQDVLLWILRTGLATPGELRAKAMVHAAPAQRRELPIEHALLILYAALEPGVRQRILAPYEDKFCTNGTRQMLGTEGVRVLRDAGTEIGAHGASHLPLTEIADPRGDLIHAREWLEAALGARAGKILSFPHGRWSPEIVSAARSLGYDLLFTSDPVLNRTSRGFLESDLIGRIAIRTKDVQNGLGRASADRLASWLYLRDRKTLRA